MTLANLEKVVERTSRGIGVPVQSCLIDTFDDERYIKEFVIPNWPRISEIGGKYVCRPDSGDAVDKPIEVVKWLLEGLEKEHGFCNVNENGIRFLPENIGVIQGDGLKLWDFERIFNIAILENLAASNFVFGFGGGMTNGSTRDDFSFSMKATAIMRADGEWVDMQKSPKTDMGKKSLKGRVGLGNDFCPLYKDGLTLSMTFDKVRERARS
jgi:nicotinamide phosphoribosyltransferase